MEQQNFGIRFSGSDKELYDALKAHFPDCQMIPSQEFEGLDILWVAIIPSVALGMQLLDFIFTHVIPRRSGDGEKLSPTDPETKREIIHDGNSLDAAELAGKSKEDVSHIFKLKFGVEFSVEMKREKK